MAISVERIADAATLILQRCDIFSNASPDLCFVQWQAYHERRASPDAIDLVRLPDALVFGSSARATIRGTYVSEQVVPGERNDGAASIPDTTASEEDVDCPVILLARYGDGTWGHWLGELLPKAAMVERLYPNRFKYIVSGRVANPHRDDTYAVRAAESLASYGIGQERLIGTRHGCTLVCADLWAVTSVWTDHVLHPAAAEALRSLDLAQDDRSRRVALMRRADAGRQISNRSEVVETLELAGYTSVDVAALSFSDQVRMFRSATSVFSVLGSGLSGLIYAPNGVAVLAAAPHRFLDRFFYALVQMRGGIYAEVRGPGDQSGFTIPMDYARPAIELMGRIGPERDRPR